MIRKDHREDEAKTCEKVFASTVAAVPGPGLMVR